jgi:hypothetical protein
VAEYWVRWDPTNKKWEVSVDGGSFTDLVERPTVESLKFKQGSDPGGSSSARLWQATENPVQLNLISDVIQLESSVSYLPAFRIVNKNADSTGSRIYVVKDSASPADGDVLGGIFGLGRDSGGNETGFAGIDITAKTVANGSEVGKLLFYIITGGSTYNVPFWMDETYVQVDPSWFFNCLARGCYVYNNADITGIVTATDTLITFNSEDRDTNTFHSTSTNTSRLTIPIGAGGRYRVWAYVRWDGVATPTGFRALKILKNSAGTYNASNVVGESIIHAQGGVASTVLGQHVEAEVSLVGNDYVELFATHTQGANMTIKAITGSLAVSPIFCLQRLGIA